MALVDELKKQSGTGAELAQQGAFQRARDFAAGKISQADYAATLRAPNLAYQDNSISAKGVPTPSFSLLPKPEAERQLEARGVWPVRALTAGIVPAANAAAPTQPSVSSAYPDEAQRGAAKTALSQLANVPETAAPNGQNFADWQKGASQMERDTAANAYQDAWKARTPSGMRGADANATALYNAEQATRGTGISAQRQKNGVMEFSGDGANALPQSYTQGVDLNLANERNARANAIRESMLDSQPGTRGIIGNSGVEETNARFQASRDRDAMQNMGRSQVNALAQMRNTDMQRERMNAEMGLRGRELESNEAYRRGTLAQQASQTDLQRERLGIDRQEVGARALTAGLQGEASRAQLAEQQRISKLRDAYQSATDDGQRQQISRAIAELSGKEPSQPRDDATKERYGLIGELAKSYSAMPPMGADGKPVPFEQYAAPVLQMANGNRGGQQADPRQQEGQVLDGKDGKKYVVRNGVPVPL